MELEEHADDNKESHLDQRAQSAEDEVEANGLSTINDLDHFLDQERDFESKRDDEREDDVEEEEHEEFSIGEAHAVGYPGAVMVHVEDAALAGGAVMASSLIKPYRSGLKLWQSRQYRLFLFSLSSAKNPQ